MAKVELRSERRLMEMVADRLSLRWYVGYDLHEPLPGHSSRSPRQSDRVRGLYRGLMDEDDEGWVVYDPIDEVPDLFLRFARLYGEPDFNKAALHFANNCGLPNGTDEAPAPSGAPGFKTEAINWSLSQFHHEARRAWVVLALYKGVLNDEDRTVRNLLSEHSGFL
jgi:hypothetical protein